VNNIGLVLEGGGMRGVYTGGVLEYFQEQQLYFPYVVGVSAGACNGASYISRQKGRNHKVTIDLVNHPNYISYKNLWRKRELFGMDFIFDEIPNSLVPFDYQTFEQVPEKFYIGTTDCHTGEPVFFEKSHCLRDDLSLVLKASSSIPLMAPVVKYKGLDLLDGGVSEPIPIHKSVRDGNDKHVVILTRPKGYQKQKQRFTWVLHKRFKQYPKLIEVMEHRYQKYNSSLQYIEEQERKGNAFVFRPSLSLKVGRIERNKEKLTELYTLGYNDAKKLHTQLNDWLEGSFDSCVE
jgi:predicted patatin/cPLA2 family phospholipase